MQPIDHAREILDTMLGYLGFVVSVETDEDHPDTGLQVMTHEPKPLIGHHGERLDDIQYLVNRLLQARLPSAPKIRVDVDHYRAHQEERLISEAEEIARQVAHTGQPVKLQPMNSWFRRVIHTHFANHPGVKTWSPEDGARVKCITLMPRHGKSG